MGGERDIEKSFLNEICPGLIGMVKIVVVLNVALESSDALLNASCRQNKHKGKKTELFFFVPFVFEVCVLQ